MNEEKYQEIRKQLQSNDKKTKDKFKEEEGVIYRRKGDQWIRVARRYEIEGIMYMMHDHPLSAHFSTKRTYDKIRERYYWPKMYQDVETYVKSCWKCQMRGKPQNKNELHPAQLIEPFYQIGIDFVGPLSTTEKGNKYIIVAIDYFTKWPEAKATNEATAEVTSQFIYEEIICRHGCPKVIITDRGSHFNNQLIEELMKKFEIKHKLSTPYHPKTNGLVERFNKTLCESLAKLTDEGKDWDKYIPSVLFAYRTNKQSSTQLEPFYLTYGRKPRLIIDKPETITTSQRIEHIIENLPRQRRRAKETNEKKQEYQKDYHDKKIKKKVDFNIGDKVLYYKAAKEKQWTGKLEDKWKGPYYIHEKFNNGAYILKELNGKLLKTPINGELLKEFNGREDFEPMITIEPIMDRMLGLVV